MTVLTPLFDALKHFRKEVARVRAAKLNAYWDRESVTRIIGEKLAARLLPKSMWKDFQKWDILIDEVPATATQQKEFLSALLEQGALPHMSQLGYHPPPEVLIEAFDIGSEKKEEWKAAIQQRMLAAQNAPPDEEGAPPQ